MRRVDFFMSARVSTPPPKATITMKMAPRTKRIVRIYVRTDATHRSHTATYTAKLFPAGTLQTGCKQFVNWRGGMLDAHAKPLYSDRPNSYPGSMRRSRG